jgi:hypothetical protein
VLDVPLGADNKTTILAWLINALEQARTTQDQQKAVGYLEAVADEVLFEMEMAARCSQ